MRLHPHQKGFTLIEVLMALSIFALIVTVSYTALGPAGVGFQQLQGERDRLESSSWLGRQLRDDVGAASASALKELKPLDIQFDARGDTHADTLRLVVREAGRSGLTLVQYHLDESTGELVREARMAWARPDVEADKMVLGEADSLQVEVMDAKGEWQSRWQSDKQVMGQAISQADAAPIAEDALFVWPKALRVTVKNKQQEKTWILPLLMGLP